MENTIHSFCLPLEPGRQIATETTHKANILRYQSEEIKIKGKESRVSSWQLMLASPRSGMYPKNGRKFQTKHHPVSSTNHTPFRSLDAQILGRIDMMSTCAS